MKDIRIQTLLLFFLLSFCVLPPTARADALDNWTPASIQTNALGKIFALTYGNGCYVAIGGNDDADNGFIDYSLDGTNWTWLPAPTNSAWGNFFDLFAVTFGNGTFVAVGYGGYGNTDIYSSTNGIVWYERTNGLVNNLNDVAYGGGKFVAVGQSQSWLTEQPTNRNIYVSSDGISWVQEKSVSSSSIAQSIYSVAYGLGVFVAVDGNGFYNSSTGISWTRTSTPIGNTVSFCNDRFMASYGAGTNMVSFDGSNWSLQTNTTATRFGKIYFTNGLYLAPPFVSSDATNWVQHNFPPATCFTLGNGRVLGTGYNLVSTTNVNKYQLTAYNSDPFVGLALQASPLPRLNISGLQGHSYRIDYQNSLPTKLANWQTLATISLTNSPLQWTDSTAANSQRYYRAVWLH